MKKTKIKILLADDNANIRESLSDLLRANGYYVDLAKDGYEVLTYLHEKSPHILILDLMMPDKNGIEILTSIRNISPKTKVIIYTAFREYKNLMLSRQADKFLVKSESPKKLLAAIEKMI